MTDHDPWQQGYAAFDDGLGIDACPYSEDAWRRGEWQAAAAREQWIRGWESAQSDDEDEG